MREIIANGILEIGARNDDLLKNYGIRTLSTPSDNIDYLCNGALNALDRSLDAVARRIAVMNFTGCVGLIPVGAYTNGGIVYAWPSETDQILLKYILQHNPGFVQSFTSNRRKKPTFAASILIVSFTASLDAVNTTVVKLGEHRELAKSAAVGILRIRPGPQQQLVPVFANRVFERR